MNRVFIAGSVPRLPTVGIIGGGQLALCMRSSACAPESLMHLPNVPHGAR